MLYMVIVPIIPDYLRLIGAWEKHEVKVPHEVFKDPVFHKEVTRYVNFYMMIVSLFLLFG